jgi:hypothetical protein
LSIEALIAFLGSYVLSGGNTTGGISTIGSTGFWQANAKPAAEAAVFLRNVHLILEKLTFMDFP